MVLRLTCSLSRAKKGCMDEYLSHYKIVCHSNLITCNVTCKRLCERFFYEADHTIQYLLESALVAITSSSHVDVLFCCCAQDQDPVA